MQRFDEKIANLLQQIGDQSQQLCNTVEKQIQAVISEILSQSPKNILQKGFALVSDLSGKLITSKLQASKNQELKIQFHDGSITVSNKS